MGGFFGNERIHGESLDAHAAILRLLAYLDALRTHCVLSRHGIELPYAIAQTWFPTVAITAPFALSILSTA